MDNDYEKISEQAIRVELIKKFKEKVNKEIDTMLERSLREIKTFSFNEIKKIKSEEYEDFEYISTEISVCLFMRKWLLDNTLLEFAVRYDSDDLIMYSISSRHLHMWTRKEFYFMKLLCDKYKLNIIMLNHYELEYHFSPITEEMIFDQSKTNSTHFICRARTPVTLVMG